ncbi:hypothetical protein MNBD_ACTINO02-2234 [hydrothermal vent metagenome]|uniref:Uncharacterized protein n=1 Tax=hydrothermal vent metagenome TaxID=652676 RepID=A0A3B0ST09_9ZZZZ
MNNTTSSLPNRSMPSVLVLAAAALVWIVLSAAPALADEFRIGILLDPATSDSTFMEGFQLAVDQSPDVSHPPGVEGGDHLGSMDVVMVVIDDATGPDGLLAAANRLVEGEGVAIIVADISPESLRTIMGPITDSGTMLLALSNVASNEFPETLRLLIVGDQSGADALLTDRAATFRDAFIEASGGAPSETATRGYISGRLVDIGVEATDRDPSDTGTLIDAMTAAMRTSADTPANDQTDSSAPPVSATIDATLAADSGQPNEPEVSSGFGGALVVGGVLGIVIVGGLILRSSPQQRPDVPR